MNRISYIAHLICEIFLIFLFVAIGSALYAAETRRDTLILDGEVIRINRVEVPVNIDSLETEASRDITRPPVVKKKYLSVLPGTDLFRIEHRSSQDSLQPLISFLGKNNAYVVQPTLTVQGTIMATSQIGFFLGVGINRIKITMTDCNENELAVDSLRIRFENREGNLWQYFYYPVGIGFETDTARVPTRQMSYVYDALNIPLGARFFITNPDNQMNKGSVFMDLGINFRWAWPAHQPSIRSALVNERGAFYRLPADAFSPRTFYMLAQFNVGAMFPLSHHWQIETCCQLKFPPYPINQSSLYQLHLSNYTFYAGVSYLFGNRR